MNKLFIVNTEMICHSSRSSTSSVLLGIDSSPLSGSFGHVVPSLVIVLEGSLVDGSTCGIVSVESVSVLVGISPLGLDALGVVSDPVGERL